MPFRSRSSFSRKYRLVSRVAEKSGRSLGMCSKVLHGARSSAVVEAAWKEVIAELAAELAANE